MDDDLKRKFDEVFAKKAESDFAADVARREGARADKSFLDRFLELREKVIRPAMVDLSVFFGEKGIATEISVEDEHFEGAPNKSRFINASIRFTIFDSARAGHRAQEFPGVGIHWDKYARRAQFHESTIGPGHGGSAGGGPAVELETITAKLVQERVLRVANDLFH